MTVCPTFGLGLPGDCDPASVEVGVSLPGASLVRSELTNIDFAGLAGAVG